MSDLPATGTVAAKPVSLFHKPKKYFVAKQKGIVLIYEGDEDESNYLIHPTTESQSDSFWALIYNTHLAMIPESSLPLQLKSKTFDTDPPVLHKAEALKDWNLLTTTQQYSLAVTVETAWRTSSLSPQMHLEVFQAMLIMNPRLTSNMIPVIRYTAEHYSMADINPTCRGILLRYLDPLNVSFDNHIISSIMSLLDPAVLGTEVTLMLAEVWCGFNFTAYHRILTQAMGTVTNNDAVGAFRLLQSWVECRAPSQPLSAPLHHTSPFLSPASLPPGALAIPPMPVGSRPQLQRTDTRRCLQVVAEGLAGGRLPSSTMDFTPVRPPTTRPLPMGGPGTWQTPDVMLQLRAHLRMPGDHMRPSELSVRVPAHLIMVTAPGIHGPPSAEGRQLAKHLWEGLLSTSSAPQLPPPSPGGLPFLSSEEEEQARGITLAAPCPLSALLLQAAVDGVRKGQVPWGNWKGLLPTFPEGGGLKSTGGKPPLPNCVSKQPGLVALFGLGDQPVNRLPSFPLLLTTLSIHPTPQALWLTAHALSPPDKPSPGLRALLGVFLRLVTILVVKVGDCASWALLLSVLHSLADYQPTAISRMKALTAAATGRPAASIIRGSSGGLTLLALLTTAAHAPAAQATRLLLQAMPCAKSLGSGYRVTTLLVSAAMAAHKDKTLTPEVNSELLALLGDTWPSALNHEWRKHLGGYYATPFEQNVLGALLSAAVDSQGKDLQAAVALLRLAKPSLFTWCAIRHCFRSMSLRSVHSLLGDVARGKGKFAFAECAEESLYLAPLRPLGDANAAALRELWKGVEKMAVAEWNHYQGHRESFTHGLTPLGFDILAIEKLKQKKMAEQTK
eukprot:gnl/Dysnectes_brevis/6717_a10631_195.p1 GENE.gnl/Dysnectes_brevis/6717_a10631_195~~gnl/Dysnectes_brevis/6717_a10631_195.p1  ORF type:complete len:842 (-),score=179.69 gnl/Dysnectes_brevis/6717_a10631_195:22-2547(-)